MENKVNKNNKNAISGNQMKKEAISIVTEYFQKFVNKFEYVPCEYKFRVPAIHFTLKGAAAGMSYFEPDTGKGELSFNPILMEENWGTFKQTIIHETAHYCVSLWKGTQYTKKGYRIQHGKDWKDMMAFFGADQKRCHNYDVSKCAAKKQKRWNYECRCCTHSVSTTIHNRIKEGRNYYCRTCGNALKIQF